MALSIVALQNEDNQNMDLYTRGKQLEESNSSVIFCALKLQLANTMHANAYSSAILPCKKNVKWYGEVDILKVINFQEHPNIVSIKDVLEDDDYIYIVMELCEGETIYDHMVEYGTFDEPRAAQMIKEIASALEACHSVGIVHRDLKLENLLFKTKEEDSALRVIDFGLAQFCKLDEVLNDAVGTPPYIAPEVMERAHGPKVDIWSLGVILYALLAGFAPFNGCTLADVYEEIMKSHDLFAKDPWPRISKGAKDLIQKMLTYNVNERLSASEVLKHPWILEMSSRLEESRRNRTQHSWMIA